MIKKHGIILSATLFVLYLNGAVWADQPDTSNSLAQYVAGLEMISQAHGVDSRQRAGLFRDLEKASGISADRAKHLLNQYRDRPEKWKEIQQAVVAILETYTSPKPDNLSKKEQHNGK